MDYNTIVVFPAAAGNGIPERKICMGFLEELLVSAKNVVDKAGKQTDKVVEVSKLKYQSIQLQNELSHLYEQLGVAVYAKMTEEYDNGDLLASLADEITEVRAALKVVEEKISEQRNEQICSVCGAKSSRDAKFCPNCGAKFGKEEPEEPVPAEEEACDCGCGETECAPEAEAEACAEEKPEGECGCGCEETAPEADENAQKDEKTEG